jgi:hypothetical protein
MLSRIACPAAQAAEIKRLLHIIYHLTLMPDYENALTD